MPGLGTIINAAAIIAGGVLGMLLKNALPQRIQDTLLKAMGVCVLFIGLSGTLEQMLFEVPFASLPADMIDTVTVDLDGMPAGTTVTVKDIPEFQSDKIELQIDADSMVLRIVDKKRAVEEDA